MPANQMWTLIRCDVNTSSLYINLSELEMAGKYNYSGANMENESLQTYR